MKKRDLLFAGLLLMGVSAIAQPTRTPQDAKVIFTQTFEDDWDAWQTTPVDTIYQLEYYKGVTGGNQAFSNAWDNSQFKADNILVRTDSVTPGQEGGIIIYNGVMLTDDKGDIDNRKYRNDNYSIVDETSQARAEAFEKWGQDGGEKAFRFISAGRYNADGTSAVGSSDNKYTDDYRRNLFVRLKNVIEPETSYRVTFYVRAKSTTASEGYAPRLHAGLYRGYFHSEKPFTMGLQDDNDHNKFNTQITYEKTDFSGDWEKVTFMDYYLNDSIADYFMLSNGYWWSDNWIWKAADNGTEDDLKFIHQPDKFFFRMSFRSDSTDFMVDNISLTKSWIAGCEYDKDKMRVDFGYKTNLGKLVEDAYKETRIDAIELPGDAFEVWCLVKGGDPDDPDAWEDMPIRSAEYHSDGYMYMFTEYFNDTPFMFDDYDQVLVTFINPVDNPKLALKYTGTGKSAAELFPKALDTTWIKEGKLVPDFYNELATPNPNIFKGVHSMKDLPPVLQGLPYEENSFGLTPVTSFEFKFSRKIVFDNLENTEGAIAYVNGTRWNMAYKEGNDSIIVISKPNAAPALSGDVEIELVQLKGLGTEYGKEVKLNYHFGSFERNPQIQFVSTSNWRAYIADYNSSSRPWPTTIYAHSGNSSDTFGLGKGNETAHKIGFYPIKDDTLTIYGAKVPDNGLFYLSSRTNPYSGNLYCIEHLTAGPKAISFKFGGQSSTDYAMSLYFYAKPNDALEDGNDKGFAVLEAVANKVVLEAGKKPAVNMGGSFSTTTEWKEGVETLTYSFTVPAEGDYVFEFVVKGSNDYKGVVIGNYWITTAGDLSFSSTTALNKSVEDANARLALADAKAELYTGVIYNDLKQKATYYAIGGDFDAAALTKPSEWAAAKKTLDDATAKLKLRMDTVDGFANQRKAVSDKLAATETQYGGLSTWAALKDVETQANAYPVTTKIGTEINEFNETMKKAIQTLDDRIALNTKYAKELTRAFQLLEDSAKTDFEEYPALKRTYEAYKNYDVIAATDDDINATYAIVNGAANDYEFRVVKSQVMPKRVKALEALSRKLGSTIGDTAIIKNALQTLEDDDDMLANVYKAAIKLALYEKLADDANIYTKDSLDLTPFIKNYHLYQTPKVVERGNLKANASDAHKADPDGANMQHVQHQYNSGSLNGQMPIWIIIQTIEYTDVYPGWTVLASTEGNQMVTGDKTYNAYVTGYPVFDAEIGMDWNTKSELWQTVDDLPAGMYTIGVELPEHKYRAATTGWGAHGANPTILNVTAADSTFEALAETDGVQTLKIDSIMVGGADSVDIKLTLWSGNGWSRADNFFLHFRQDPDFAYDEAVEGLQDEIAGLLTIVNPAKAVAANVEYYTLGGVQVAAPKAGQILIRKTNVNGKVVVDKVLLK